MRVETFNHFTTMTEQTTTAAVQTATPVQATTAATPARKEQKVTFDVAGKEVTLSIDIVRRYLVSGDATKVSEQDIVQFINMCKFNQLNPFLKEAYLVKYGNNPAQMVVSKEAFLKRANNDPDYDGLEAGIIIQRGDEILEIEGGFMMQTDILLGGWAKVYHKNRRVPFVSKVSLKEFSKGQSTWNQMPATMIRKVAEVQALREAFPTQLGAMYIQEEQRIVDAEYTEIKSASLDEVAKQAVEGK